MVMQTATVSADWPDDPYRAPEVEGGVADATTDLFSWARILLHAAASSLNGMVDVTTSSSRSDASMFVTAGPDNTGCVQ